MQKQEERRAREPDEGAAGEQHQEDEDEQDDDDPRAHLAEEVQERKPGDRAEEAAALDLGAAQDAFDEHVQQVVALGQAHLEDLQRAAEEDDQHATFKRTGLEGLVHREQRGYVQEGDGDEDRAPPEEAEHGVVQPVPAARALDQGERGDEDADPKEDDRVDLPPRALLGGVSFAGGCGGFAAGIG